MSAEFPLVFDGHNDTVLSLERTGRSFFTESDEGHIDLPRAGRGGLGGGFFAIYIPNPEVGMPAHADDLDDADEDRFDNVFGDKANWPEIMPLDFAQSRALTLLGQIIRLEEASNGGCKIVRTASELETCLNEGIFAIELHFEGAEPLDPAGDALEVFYAAGLRSVGLTHSRRNIFTEGVPFSFPAAPDTGPGLNDAGKELVRQLNRKKMLIDLSHITERGFWDVAELTDAPLVATHSNVWNLSKTPRNLTDRMMQAIGECQGIAGLNFHVGFLREDGQDNPDTSVATMANHIDYMVEKMGIDCVGIGSDYDGATMPSPIHDAAGLPVLMSELRDRGYSEPDLEKIAHGNWVRVLRETWGE